MQYPANHNQVKLCEGFAKLDGSLSASHRHSERETVNRRERSIVSTLLRFCSLLRWMAQQNTALDFWTFFSSQVFLTTDSVLQGG